MALLSYNGLGWLAWLVDTVGTALALEKLSFVVRFPKIKLQRIGMDEYKLSVTQRDPA